MDAITIIQGDDTNFLDDQFIVVNFNTKFPMSGFTATFTLGDVTFTYGNLGSKKIEIVLPSAITSNFAIGKQYGELKLIDTQNRIRTVTSIIPFLIKKGVNESITFINNAINISMNVNDTTIDITVETAGIAKAEAEKLLLSCNDAKQTALNSANTAQTTAQQMNTQYVEVSEKMNYISNAIGTVITDLNNTKNIAIQQFNDNFADKMNVLVDIDTSVNNAVNKSTEYINKAQNWAVGSIQDNPKGSAKHWAELAEQVVKGDAYLRKDGSVDLTVGYAPVNPQSIATKSYCDYVVLSLESNIQNSLNEEKDARILSDNAIQEQITGLNSSIGEISQDFLGLGNVDNTSDIDKPISLAVQSELDNKENKVTAITDTSSLSASITLEDNTRYQFTKNLTSLTIAFPTGQFISEVSFYCGSPVTTLSVPSSCKWAGKTSPALEVNTSYRMTFAYDGLNVKATCLSFGV